MTSASLNQGKMNQEPAANPPKPLTGLAKLIKAAPGHPTRFHTERSHIMPVDAWLRLPLTIAERFLPPRERPWIVPSAVSFLNKTMQPDWSVLEIGAGYSTPWLERRCSTLLSFETDRDWFELLRLRTHCDLRLVDGASLLEEITKLPESSFDLVFIDNEGDRLSMVRVARTKVKPGGLLLLDDSSRYPKADSVLSGWRVRRFVGMKPSPLTAVETSIYFRRAVAVLDKLEPFGSTFRQVNRADQQRLQEVQ